MSIETIIVAVIVLLAALYAGRTLYRQAKREEGCGSCGGCCPTPDERESKRHTGPDNASQGCAGCQSMSSGAPIADKPRG